MELLRTASGFRSLLVASFASGVGTMLAVIALTVDIYERTGSGAWVSALLIADFLPTIAIGLLLGPLIDRLSRRALMIGADLARLVVFAALPFAGSPGAIVALALVVGLANGFFNPAAQAALPNLVRADELARANALYQSSSNLTWLLGPLAGGALLAVSGTDLAYGINAATFAVSAVFIARIPGWSFSSERAVSKGHRRDLVEGFELIRRSRALLAVTVAWTLATFGTAAINVAEVFLVRETLGAGNVELGLVMGAAGLGLVLGSIVVGSLLEQRSIGPVYGGSLLLMALGFGGAAIAPSVWVVLVLVVVAGIGNGGAVVCNPVLVQVGAPDRLRGRAFTVVMSITYVAFAAAMIGAGALTDAVGPRVLWGAAAGICAVAAVAGAVLARGIHAVALDDRYDALPVASLPVVGVGERVT
jgi:MFS family permease